MPIIKKYNAFFIHIPKTGGTSIERFFDIREETNKDLLYQIGGEFEEIDGIKYALQHYTSKIAKLKVPDYENMFSFCFVRNPYDRIVSEYFYRLRIKKQSLSVCKRHNINYYKEFFNKKQWLKEFINDNGCHSIPQSFFIDENIDYIGKFERFNDDFFEIMNKLAPGYSFPIPHENKSERFEKFLFDSEMLDMVNQKYNIDFKNFNYDFYNGELIL